MFLVHRRASGLHGEIYRGRNDTIEAVIWISDLRGFTRMSDELAPPVMLGILNDHFERVVGAIEEQGGEVLKFMGDSVLAIFPTTRPQRMRSPGSRRATASAARPACTRSALASHSIWATSSMAISADATDSTSR